MLQCGDPLGGTGTGPGLHLRHRERAQGRPVPAGHPGDGPHQRPEDGNGDQFFIVYKDTDAAATRRGYTIFGTVTGGMDIVDKIAAAGVQRWSAQPTGPRCTDQHPQGCCDREEGLTVTEQTPPADPTEPQDGVPTEATRRGRRAGAHGHRPGAQRRRGTAAEVPEAEQGPPTARRQPPSQRLQPTSRRPATEPRRPRLRQRRVEEAAPAPVEETPWRRPRRQRPRLRRRPARGRDRCPSLVGPVPGGGAQGRPPAPHPDRGAAERPARPSPSDGSPTTAPSSSRTGDEEREVGSYPGATPDEALHYFARKYDELFASADLLHQRLTTTDLSAKDVAEGLAKLREHAAEADVVGDLAALDAKIAEIADRPVAERKKTESAERSAARAAAATEREAIVAEAEKIAGQPENKIQWKTSGARMRELLDEWKKHQRVGARASTARPRRPVAAVQPRPQLLRQGPPRPLRRARRARTPRRRRAKEAARRRGREARDQHRLGRHRGCLQAADGPLAPAPAGPRGPTTTRCGSASRPPRTPSSRPRTRSSAAEDEEFRGNLAVKEELLNEAEAILPVTDLEAAKAAAARHPGPWEAAGKVPRADVERDREGDAPHRAGRP